MLQVLASILTLTFAGSPSPEEKLIQPPTPAILFPDAPPPESMIFFQKDSAYRHWQYLGVSRTGTFRPRVVYTSEGAFYLHNGMDYPFVNNRRSDFIANDLGFKPLPLSPDTDCPQCLDK
jgi:hypothetical protein